MKSGEARPFHVQTLTYVPFFRILVALLLLGVVVMSVLRFRMHVRLHSVLWLFVPLGIAVLLGVIMPKQYGIFTGHELFWSQFIPVAITQLVSLPLVLLVTSAFHRRARTMAFIAGWGINGIVILVQSVVMFPMILPNYVLWGPLIIPLTRHLVTVFGLIAVRKRFSKLRYAVSLIILWCMVATVLVGVECAIYGGRWLGDFVSSAIQADVVYVTGFWLFVAFIPWWRERVFRAYGITPSA